MNAAIPTAKAHFTLISDFWPVNIKNHNPKYYKLNGAFEHHFYNFTSFIGY